MVMKKQKELLDAKIHNLIINKSHGTEQHVMDPPLEFRDRQSNRMR